MLPTAERVEIRVLDFVRFHEGKMIEHWAAMNPVERKI